MAEDAARGGEQPGLRLAGHAAGGPGFQRQAECLGQRILGGGHVAGAGGQDRDQAAIGVARRLFGQAARILFGHRAMGGITGRTSVLP